MVVQSLAPRDSVSEFRDEMDRLLTGFLGDLTEGWPGGQGRLPVNAWENDESLFVEIEVPGLANEQIDVAECRAGVLVLHLPKAEAAKPRKIKVKSL